MIKQHTNGTNGYHELSSADPGHILESLGISTTSVNAGLVGPHLTKTTSKGETIESFCPSTGKVLGTVETVSSVCSLPYFKLI